MNFAELARARENSDTLGIPTTDTNAAALEAVNQMMQRQQTQPKKRTPFRLAALARLNPMTMGQAATGAEGGMR